MQERKNNSFYRFDDENQEIVFLRNDMPSPWMNYLTNGTFYTMMSHSGGNVSWYKYPEFWRIGRYNFFNLPVDVQGFFIYIKDLSTGITWNPTIIPCDVKLDKWESRHGLGYTRFIAEKDGLKVNATCFVGKDNALIYSLKIVSNSNRKIEVFAAQEMGLMEYLREVQWQCYCKNSNNILFDKKNDALIYEYFNDAQPSPTETPFVGFLANKKCSSYSGSRKDFVGYYRNFSNPIAIEEDRCPNTELKGGEAMFSMSFDINLETNIEEELTLALVTVGQNDTVDAFASKLREKDYTENSFKYVKQFWKNRQNKFSVDIPDLDSSRMMNVWNQLQCYVNLKVGRSMSYYATGTARGIGTRDSLQDLMSSALFDPIDTKERLFLILAHQYKAGNFLHNFKMYDAELPDITPRSDDHLWAIFSVYNLICELGDVSVLDEIIPYYDDGCGTLFNHLEQCFNYCLANIGVNGLPLMLRSDWNDMLTNVCKKGKGESVMVAEQLVLVAKQMIEICKFKKVDYSKYEHIIKNQTDIINNKCWDGNWYIRAISDEGLRIGSNKEPVGKIWDNAQSWAVISGVATPDKASKAITSMMDMLDSGFGLMKLAPALIRNYPSKENELTFAQPGIGENAGVFNHASAWGIIANCILGRHEEAYKLYRDMIPHNIVNKVGVDRYNAEPYIYASNIRSKYSLTPGEAGVSWLSGTSTWMMIAIEQYIFGIKPRLNGLLIEPCIPNHWKETKVIREFRGIKYNFIYINNNCDGANVKKIIVNGSELNGRLIPLQEKESFVEIYFG